MIGITASALQRRVNPLPSDPFFSDVIALIDFDGAAGGSTFTDSSNDARTITNLGSIVRVADPVSWGHAAGADFTATGGQRLEMPDSADWRFDDVFTFEVRAKFDSFGGFRSILNQGAGLPSADAFSLYTNPSSVLELFIATGVSSNVGLMGPTLSTGTEYEIAITRNSSGVYRMYVNGTLQGSTVTTTASFDSAEELSIGGGANGAEVMDGRVFEMRWTRGVDRYGASSYTPLIGKFPKQ